MDSSSDCSSQASQLAPSGTTCAVKNGTWDGSGEVVIRKKWARPATGKR
jgi:hypothetical protein